MPILISLKKLKIAFVLNKKYLPIQSSMVLVGWSIFFYGCIEHTLIPGQIEQQGQISRRVPPQHNELLQGGLLQQKIASPKLVNRVRFLAFYPLHLIALGNFVEKGDQEKVLPSSSRIRSRSDIVSEEKKQHKIRQMLISKEAEEREIAAGLIQRKDNLLVSLYNDDEYVRLATVHKLKEHTFLEIEPHLLQLLNDSNKFVRLETIRALKSFPTKVILPYTYLALLDQNSIVRAEAIDVLVLLKALESIEKLWKMLNDTEIFIRKKAMQALETLTKISVTFPYNGTPKVRKDSIDEWKEKWEKRKK